MERTKQQQEREIARLRKTSEKLRGYGATRVSQRVAVDKRIATLQRHQPQLPQTSRRIKIDFPVRQPTGQLVIMAEDLTKSYGSKEIFRNMTFKSSGDNVWSLSDSTVQVKQRSCVRSLA